jgi:two-component system sensor histidine kinase/response regulator
MSQSSTNSEYRPIDEQVLKDIFGEDKETIRDILKAYPEPTRKIIDELKNGWECHSSKSIKDAAHKLKSSARTIGANRLADLCAKLEAAAIDNDWNTINDNVTGLDQFMEDIIIYVNHI